MGDIAGIHRLKNKLAVGMKWEAVGKNTGGKMRRRVFVEGKRNDAVLGVFFNFIFYSNKGILVTLHPQNDIILGFPSIFTVLSNGGGQIIKG